MADRPQPLFGAPGWPEHLTFAPAVRVGDVVYLSGTTGADDEGRIAEGDMAEQARQIFRKFDRILAPLGASCRDIVSTTDYVVTTRDYKKTAAVRREFFGATLPASTGVVVAGLVRPHALIEISAIAVLPEGAR
ncbi:Rid family hydrolase [Pigmentiphaga soli]|uniref:Rid family hydrolase n=1 Tax=Pigmentiphaga soli TaxID=1007095 RepID=A0ABP8HIQ9_9BURK